MEKKLIASLEESLGKIKIPICNIMFTPIDDPEKVVDCTNCKKSFDEDNIIKWLSSGEEHGCPCCKSLDIRELFDPKEIKYIEPVLSAEEIRQKEEDDLASRDCVLRSLVPNIFPEYSLNLTDDVFEIIKPILGLIQECQKEVFVSGDKIKEQEIYGYIGQIFTIFVETGVISLG
jgi:hypothetical protein